MHPRVYPRHTNTLLRSLYNDVEFKERFLVRAAVCRAARSPVSHFEHDTRQCDPVKQIRLIDRNLIFLSEQRRSIKTLINPIRDKYGIDMGERIEIYRSHVAIHNPVPIFIGASVRFITLVCRKK